MPYKSIADLPETVREHLPDHGQDIYKEAFNNAWRQYANPKDRRDGSSREETSHRVAWAAVKREYEKDEATGQWHLRS